MLSVTARAVRAKIGIDTTPTAMMTFCVLAPRMATIASAKTMSGKLSITSIARMTSASNQPRRQAAITPSGTPTRNAKATPPTPTPSVARAPSRMRLKTSRPSWSVPNQCSADGGFSVWAKFCLNGSSGASMGPKMASSR